MKKCFALILGCEKYTHKRLMQDLDNFPFEYRYFLGNPELDEPIEDNKIVYLPCSDNYEYLPIKVRLGIKWIVENIPDVSYIFKTDDDITFNGEKLLTMYRSQILKKSLDYCGHRIDCIAHFSNHHKGSCESEVLNHSSLYVPNTIYCSGGGDFLPSGGGYFLSKKSFDIINNEFDIDKNPFLKNYDQTIYEDVMTGGILNYFSIFPTQVNIESKVL